MGWSISSFVESLGGEGRVGKKERTLSEGGGDSSRNGISLFEEIRSRD